MKANSFIRQSQMSVRQKCILIRERISLFKGHEKYVSVRLYQEGDKLGDEEHTKLWLSASMCCLDNEYNETLHTERERLKYPRIFIV